MINLVRTGNLIGKVNMTIPMMNLQAIHQNMIMMIWIMMDVDFNAGY